MLLIVVLCSASDLGGGGGGSGIKRSLSLSLSAICCVLFKWLRVWLWVWFLSFWTCNVNYDTAATLVELLSRIVSYQWIVSHNLIKLVLVVKYALIKLNPEGEERGNKQVFDIFPRTFRLFCCRTCRFISDGGFSLQVLQAKPPGSVRQE